MLDCAAVVNRRMHAVALFAALVCGGPVGAQTVTSTLAENTAAHGFEVATIRPADRGDGRHWFGVRVLPSGRYMASAMNLNNLMRQAYAGNVRTARVKGGPKWADTDVFDINAKLEDADTQAWMKLSDRDRLEFTRPALRMLLEQRFKVKVHTETEIEPVYALVQAKHGAKLKEVPAPEPEDPQQADARMQGHGPKGPPPGGFTMGVDEWVATAVPIGGLLGQLQYELKLDHILVDETGLKGYYAFDMKFSRDKDGPTMEQQVEDQLGLKVESHKAPITVYVIDSAEKPSLDGAEQ